MKATEAALRLGLSATAGQSQARRRCQRLLPPLASRLAPSPPSSAHRLATLGFSFPPSASAGLRSFLTVTGASNTATDPQDQQDSETNPPPASVPAREAGFKVRDTSNLKISPRHDLAMIFTCKVCETRSMKMASKDSYQNGVVVVRCGGCNNLHLIADRLGWFGEPGSIEDFLATQGEEVKKGSTDTLNFTLDDLAGSQVSSSSDTCCCDSVAV